MARPHCRGQHGSGSYCRDSQGARRRSQHAEDYFRSRISAAWRLDDTACSAAPPAELRSAGAIAAFPFVTNVPVAASALIGRESAVEQLCDLLSAYRIVTLTGPGGIGKTVLASEVARRLFPTSEGDVLFIELVSLSDPNWFPRRLPTSSTCNCTAIACRRNRWRERSAAGSSCWSSTTASMSLMPLRRWRKPFSAFARTRRCWRRAEKCCVSRASSSTECSRWRCRRSIWRIQTCSRTQRRTAVHRKDALAASRLPAGERQSSNDGGDLPETGWRAARH